MKIAEAVDDAWHRTHGPGDLEVPVSVVAALSFLSPADAEHDQAARLLLSLDLDTFTQVMRTQWAQFANARPDLVNRVWRLAEPWHGQRPLSELSVRAAKRVADAAIRAGQLHLTGTETRRETDLFGALLSVLRSRSARSARGLFYTPGVVAELMARMLGTAEGETVHEPAAGTGGLLRAVAQELRRQGRDPATVTWIAVDVDELAVACLAVNVVLWELGPNVLIGVGNGLTDEWVARAVKERQETIDLAANIRHLKHMRAVLQRVDALTHGQAGERSTGEPPRHSSAGDHAQHPDPGNPSADLAGGDNTDGPPVRGPAMDPPAEGQMRLDL